MSLGIAAVKRIVQQEGLRGVYGPLVELFECADPLMTAVEVAAGGRLFDIVVDTDETASHLLETLSHDRVGRVTFMPLNQITVCTFLPPFPLIRVQTRRRSETDQRESRCPRWRCRRQRDRRRCWAS